MRKKVLIIDDDVHLVDILADYLEQNGYAVIVARDGGSGLLTLDQQHANGDSIDLVILDRMLPDMDGLDVCRRLRGMPLPLGQTAVLMLSAKDGPQDRIVGLEIGADDYMPKPFEPRELLARIRAILRRNRKALKTETPTLRFGTLEIDALGRMVTVSGEPRDLTSYQFDLLLALAERAGRVLTRDQIMGAVRGREIDPFDRSIDVHMGRIRAAIEVDQKEPKRILTVRGVGYVFARQQD